MSKQHRGVARGDAIAIACVLVFAALLLPGVGEQRARGTTEMCAVNLGNLAIALGYYTTEHDGWFPGVNTTGVAVRATRAIWSSDPNALHRAELPVQNLDWLTPLARYTTALPDNRAARWHAVWEQFSCPAQATPSTPYAVDVVDVADFTALSWRAASYLMPASFSYWGQAQSGQILGYYAGLPTPIRAAVAPAYWEVRTPTFVSRLSDVGPAARKVFLADGTRYVDATGLVDFEINPFPDFFGAFSDSLAWWAGCNSTGVATGTRNWKGDAIATGSTPSGRNLDLTYRHRGSVGAPLNPGGRPGSVQANFGAINVLCFDGHVELLGDRASREIDRWYPIGAVVQQGVQTTTVPAGTVLP
jgi:hypothetical protein